MSDRELPTVGGNAAEPRRAAIYFRSAAQADQLRINQDVDACRAVAEAARLRIAEVYIDNGFSGLSEARPAWTLLQQAVEAGKVNAIVTRDPTRIGRGGAAGDILGRLASAGVPILFVDPDARWSSPSADGEPLSEALGRRLAEAARGVRRLGTRPVSERPRRA
jgi:DNA invertase Pin-like site-specific DNA recombinase